MTWTYIEPGEDGEVVEHFVSREEILSTYYPWWCEQMRKAGKADQISEEHCIEDWITVNWASLVD